MQQKMTNMPEPKPTTDDSSDPSFDNPYQIIERFKLNFIYDFHIFLQLFFCCSAIRAMRDPFLNCASNVNGFEFWIEFSL